MPYMTETERRAVLLIVAVVIASLIGLTATSGMRQCQASPDTCLYSMR